MRAVVQNGYGSQDVLSLTDIERPAVGERDVLVRVHATSVNAGDHFFQMSGSPWLVRLMLGLRPRDHVLGWDVAGRVEAVGARLAAYGGNDSTGPVPGPRPATPFRPEIRARTQLHAGDEDVVKSVEYCAIHIRPVAGRVVQDPLGAQDDLMGGLSQDKYLVGHEVRNQPVII